MSVRNANGRNVRRRYFCVGEVRWTVSQMHPTSSRICSTFEGTTGLVAGGIRDNRVNVISSKFPKELPSIFVTACRSVVLLISKTKLAHVRYQLLIVSYTILSRPHPNFSATDLSQLLHTSGWSNVESVTKVQFNFRVELGSIAFNENIFLLPDLWTFVNVLTAFIYLPCRR